MAIVERLNEELRIAMRAGDEARKTAFRMALSAIRNAEIAGGGKLDDEGALRVLSKEVKQRRESIDAFKKGGRADLVDREQAEIAALVPYLPQQLRESDVERMARAIIAETGAAGPQDRGKVMPLLMKSLAGRADGRLANQVVTRLLSPD
ncbi:MAG: GatB/YqeY domain-containing protein [Dehalococcoidia bacterium]|nr:GatB/YqeY domain-containing protein [Dehalococcoidia bacterium]